MVGGRGRETSERSEQVLQRELDVEDEQSARGPKRTRNERSKDRTKRESEKESVTTVREETRTRDEATRRTRFSTGDNKGNFFLIYYVNKQTKRFEY